MIARTLLARPSPRPLRSRAHRSRRPRLSLSHLVAAVALAIAGVLHLATPGRAAGIETALDATLVVYSDDLDEAFLGSAFLWGNGAVAITNQHVVGDARTVELRTRDGRRLSAPVIARDSGRDIALIAVPGAVLGRGLEPARALPAIGEPVYALGAPLETEFSATQGMISATGRQIEDAMPIRYIQHDAAVNPGSSGGPLVDRDGRLVGMNSQIADGSRLFVGIAYAISAGDLTRLVPLMVAGDLRPVPDLGLRLRAVSRKIGAALGIEPASGLLVDSVRAGSIAERAGLRAGDVLLALAGDPLRVPGDLAFRLDGRDGDLPEVEVLRGHAPIRLTLDLAPAAPRLARYSMDFAPGRIESYTLSGLGVACDADGRVGGLNPASPAGFAGLAEGDRILSINGEQLAGIDLAAVRITGPLLLLVERGNDTLHVIVDPWGKGRGPRPVGGANVLDPAVVLF